MNTYPVIAEQEDIDEMGGLLPGLQKVETFKYNEITKVTIDEDGTIVSMITPLVMSEDGDHWASIGVDDQGHLYQMTWPLDSAIFSDVSNGLVADDAWLL